MDFGYYFWYSQLIDNVAEKHKSTQIIAKQVVEWDPQFIFGIILLVAWLIFLIIPLSVFKPTLDEQKK
jgi:hypothetical protein